MKLGLTLNTKGELGQIALMYAALNGHSECVKALLEAGANVDAVDNDGNSALHKAALNGRSECVEALLEAGADPNTKGELGQIALMYAALNGHSECVEALIDAGADPNAIVKSTSELTALIRQSHGRSECVGVLIHALLQSSSVGLTGSLYKQEVMNALTNTQQKLFDLKNVLSEANTNPLSASDTIGKINGLGLSKGYIDNLLKQAKKKGYPNYNALNGEIDKTSPDLMKHVYQEVAKFHGKMAAQIAHSDKVSLEPFPPDINVIIFNNLPFSSLMNVATASGLSVKSLAAHSGSPNAHAKPTNESSGNSPTR